MQDSGKHALVPSYFTLLTLKYNWKSYFWNMIAIIFCVKTTYASESIIILANISCGQKILLLFTNNILHFCSCVKKKIRGSDWCYLDQRTSQLIHTNRQTHLDRQEQENPMRGSQVVCACRLLWRCQWDGNHGHKPSAPRC